MSWTEEEPVPGVKIFQPAKAFRYGGEAFWLVGFALEGAAPQAALDLGTGSGVMGVLLAAQGCRVVGIDHREEWEPFWKKTLEKSQLAGSMRFLLQDVLACQEKGFDLVVSNPPFFRAGDGPASPNPWKRAARTEGTARIADFVAAGGRALGPKGRLCMVFPVSRESDVLMAASRAGLFPVRRAQVGRLRVILEMSANQRACADEILAEDSARVKRWYALATKG